MHNFIHLNVERILLFRNVIENYMMREMICENVRRFLVNLKNGLTLLEKLNFRYIDTSDKINAIFTFHIN